MTVYVVYVVYVVSVYLIDRAYGGPEEGGWYYTYGIPSDDPEHILHLYTFHSEEFAQKHAKRLQEYLDQYYNEGRPPISSVSSQGIYVAHIDENKLPEPWPKTRPHYE